MARMERDLRRAVPDVVRVQISTLSRPAAPQWRPLHHALERPGRNRSLRKERE